MAAPVHPFRLALIGLTLVLVATTGGIAHAADDDWTIEGGGWGHGVGLSQWGAYGMALDGYSADQILAH